MWENLTIAQLFSEIEQLNTLVQKLAARLEYLHVLALLEYLHVLAGQRLTDNVLQIVHYKGGVPGGNCSFFDLFSVPVNNRC